MRARIIRSQIETCGSVEVIWNDSFSVYFSADDLSLPPVSVSVNGVSLEPDEIQRRVKVSRLSANLTVQGCGVQKVSR